jgi:hypothetical protein
MALLKMKVTYADEREVTVVVTPKAQVEVEDFFKGTEGAQSHRIKSHYRLAWASLHHSGREPADFDTFLGLIADVEEIDPTVEDEKATDPTRTAATTTGSSD